MSEAGRRDPASGAIERRAAMRLLAFGVTSALIPAGCQDAASKRAATEARDRAGLDDIVAADGRVDRALKAADDASRAGDDARAAAILDADAARLADQAVATANARVMGSAWASARRDELIALLTERRAEIPRYAAALRGDDLEAKLRAVEAQVALQRRAVAIATAVLAGPNDDRGAPDAHL